MSETVRYLLARRAAAPAGAGLPRARSCATVIGWSSTPTRSLDVPDGVTLADAAQVLPRRRRLPIPGTHHGLRRSVPLSAASRSRRLVGRYRRLLSHRDPARRSRGPGPRKSNGRINNAILKFPAGDPDCARLVRRGPGTRRRSPAAGARSGPALVTEVLGEAAGSGACAGAAPSSIPCTGSKRTTSGFRSIGPKSTRASRAACSCICWMKALTDCGIDLHRAPPAGSWLASVTRDEEWPRRKLPVARMAHPARDRALPRSTLGAPKLASIENDRAARRRAHG